MKEVSVFLASSIDEFKYERIDLGDFIRKITDQTIEQDMYLKFSVCENMSNSVSKSRKQEEYNQEIRKSDFFYVIFGKKAGEYTIEELDIAAQQFKETGKPAIFVYSQKPIDNMLVADKDKLILDRIRGENDGISYREYTHIDNMKLDIINDFIEKKIFTGKVSVEKEKVLLNGKKLFRFENMVEEE